MKPIFHEGALQFIAINRAHHGDVGGIEPGSYAPSARELFHEGIRIPPLRIYRDDKPIMDVVNMIRINTRMPDALWVDMKAQVASCRVAEKRILELLGKYGVEKTRATIEDIHQLRRAPDAQGDREPGRRRVRGRDVALTPTGSATPRSGSRWPSASRGTRPGSTSRAPTPR